MPFGSCVSTSRLARRRHRKIAWPTQHLPLCLSAPTEDECPLSEHGPPLAGSVESADRTRRLTRIAPGLSALLHYRFSNDFRHDAIAGLSVAAVALPVSIAYAQLAGFDPVVGLYSSILPLVIYAIFGTSRQLMVNPDAAACAMIAAAIAPLAGNSAELYLSLTTALTLLTGLFCIGQLFPPRCAGGFSVQTNSGRVSQWRRHQHLSRPDRKAVGLLGRELGRHTATA